MHEFIPNRSRLELKQKFNREHRINPRRMDETLRHPVLLDGRLRQRVERFHAELANKRRNVLFVLFEDDKFNFFNFENSLLTFLKIFFRDFFSI
uniref:Transcription factor TFIIIB component B'' Myb domain-containing protein n=1 Tax=Meloidogyne enterolobii TaxID=390850 RepID=A0A6V7TSZ0_MELEN|nr:unnamed protein product [Meloidogyne enterolobii]